ncbi:aspartate/glutamate racemase family protein [Corticimicrobacter populi]|uniref:Aspartate racemase n=1 Tax=Corticimicrobacter populi TaxID=2175229 RepID=A0A2V1JU60_9BURK|nr:aspartate/glutamate racemase family protein [Corticimicrobacter populi]PWF21436.1 aspartate racemase [Corticimicrobacter populi]
MPSDLTIAASVGAVAPAFRLGVLGGMGPLATVDFMHKLVLATPARIDQEHVPAVVWNVPQIADRQQAIAGTGPSPLPQLLEGVAQLNRAGATLIVIPCNTVHHWIEPLRAASAVPFLHIVDATLEALVRSGAGAGLSFSVNAAVVADRAVAGPSSSDDVDAQPTEAAGPTRIGLIATQGALQTRLYQDRLVQHGYEVLENTVEELDTLFTPGCYAIKRNALDDGALLLEAAAQALVDRGAQRLVLACTEVPLALAHGRSALLAHSVDPNQALAEAVAARWLALREA